MHKLLDRDEHVGQYIIVYNNVLSGQVRATRLKAEDTYIKFVKASNPFTTQV
jgi:hypothetical protein